MRSLFVFCLPLLLLSPGCAPSAVKAPAAVVTGKVTLARQGVAGVAVEAYPTASLSLAEDAPYRSAASDVDGQYHLSVPAGEYYVFARGDGHFAYFGRNPVTVPVSGLDELNIALVRPGGAGGLLDSFATTGIVGKVTVEGEPLAGATVYVYTDLSSRLKGMGYAMAGPTDEQGTFEVALPAGTYYLLVRKRHGEGRIGPLRAGDHIGYFVANPVVVRDGAVSRADIAALAVPEKVSRLEGTLFGDTSIRGRVTNGDGRPAAGLRVLVYDDPQMFNRPLFVSQPTDARGAFVLSLPSGGRYFLAARSTLGGAPGPGELFGTYDGNADHAVELESGSHLEGIEIKVEEMW